MIRELHTRASEMCTTQGGKSIGQTRVDIGFIDLDPNGEIEADRSYQTYSAAYLLKGSSQWKYTKAFEDPEEMLAELHELLDFEFAADREYEEQKKAKEPIYIQGNAAFEKFYSHLKATG